MVSVSRGDPAPLQRLNDATGLLRLSAELGGEKIRMFQAMQVAVLVFTVPNFSPQK